MARRRNKKGRAIAGIMMGIRKELIETATRMVVEKEEAIVAIVRIVKERLKILGVYVAEGIERAEGEK